MLLMVIVILMMRLMCLAMVTMMMMKPAMMNDDISHICGIYAEEGDVGDRSASNEVGIVEEDDVDIDDLVDDEVVVDELGKGRVDNDGNDCGADDDDEDLVHDRFDHADVDGDIDDDVAGPGDNAIDDDNGDGKANDIDDLRDNIDGLGDERNNDGDDDDIFIKRILLSIMIFVMVSKLIHMIFLRISTIFATHILINKIVVTTILVAIADDNETNYDVDG